MEIRCLVFSTDTPAAEAICRVLAEMGGDAQHCPEAVAAVERVAKEPFQIVIVDWDHQAEAEFFLKAARGRKVSERPLTLALVSEDAGVPQALQAGANSILRKPILTNQVRDTLQTARSLLKARQDSAAAAAAGAHSAATAGSALPDAGNDRHLRAGEFLQTTAPAPSSQIDTESEMQHALDQAAAAEIDPLKELEPMAAAVSQEPAPPPPSPAPGEPRGLQWYLNRAASSSAAAEPVAVGHQPITAPPPAKPELLSFAQTPTYSERAQAARMDADTSPSSPDAPSAETHEQEQEAALFSYMEAGSSPSDEGGGHGFRPGKGLIAAAVALAVMGIAVAPQAPWHPQLRGFWSHGRQALQAWLNPQPVTPPQAPPSHEDFGRAGDEYKLPVAEAIPDATTDPSQIRVTPMVDPTAKKNNPPDPNLAPADGNATPADATQPSDASGSSSAGQPGATVGSPAPAITVTPTSPESGPPATTAVSATSARPDPFETETAKPTPVVPAPPRKPQPRPVATSSPTPPIPSSLKTQMASPTPEMSGNKAPETALPTIEPVSVPEATERGLAATQPVIPYPASAKGQQGTVVLQVLIGRDGVVQDAKFLQGSLAFARTAIDGVKQWQFKPYIMNGRPVSVVTNLTLSFRPGT